jgi:hypothetical protein
MRPELKADFGYAKTGFERYKGGIGLHGAGETPVPIPNTEVKPSIGYNTWVLALGK